jgi:hypothetical protein
MEVYRGGKDFPCRDTSCLAEQQLVEGSTLVADLHESTKSVEADGLNVWT